MNPSSPQREDPDITRLRALLREGSNSYSPPKAFSPVLMEANPKEQIAKMQTAIGQLRFHNQNLGQQNRQLVNQLCKERQENAVLRKMKEQSDREREQLLRQVKSSYTPINRLDGPNRDQLLRLSSYMLEHNRNTKILTEKLNYLLKVRQEGGRRSDEEDRVIENTQRMLGESCRLEEAHRAVGRVQWVRETDSDNESSQIEQQKNTMYNVDGNG